MKGRRFVNRRRFRRAKREYMWVTVQGDFFGLDGATNVAQEQALIVPADWARDAASGHLEKGCLLVRSIVHCRAYLAPDVSPPNAVELVWGLAGLRRVDQDDTAALNAGPGGNYFAEDWFCQEQFSLNLSVSTVPTIAWVRDSGSNHVWKWDSKVKRKLTTQDEVRFSAALSFDVSGTSAASVFFGARMLLQLP